MTIIEERIQEEINNIKAKYKALVPFFSATKFDAFRIGYNEGLKDAVRILHGQNDETKE